MIRKSLLWGLTLVLVAAIISLAIRSRRLERQQAAQGVEVVHQSESMPTRVLSPKDLEIVNSTMQLNSRPAGEVEIRNNGSVPYFQIQLRFAFLDRDGRGLAAKALLISQTLMPGKTIRVPGPALGEIPLSAVKTKITILYADIGPAPSQSR